MKDIFQSFKCKSTFQLKEVGLPEVKAYVSWCGYFTSPVITFPKTVRGKDSTSRSFKGKNVPAERCLTAGKGVGQGRKPVNPPSLLSAPEQKEETKRNKRYKN